MLRKAFSLGGLLLLAGATALVTPGLGRAQHGGVGRGSDRGHPYAHYGYRHSYGGYSAYLDSGYYGSYDAYSGRLPAVTDQTGYNGSYGDVAPSYSYGSPSFGYSPYYAPATDNSAHITVKAPAGARVSFDGAPTTSTSPVREFTSPPLRPGIRYTYVVQARWDNNGREEVQSQEIEVRAGAHIDVSFSGPSWAAGRAR